MRIHPGLCSGYLFMVGEAPASLWVGTTDLAWHLLQLQENYLDTQRLSFFNFKYVWVHDASPLFTRIWDSPQSTDMKKGQNTQEIERGGSRL